MNEETTRTLQEPNKHTPGPWVLTDTGGPIVIEVEWPYRRIADIHVKNPDGVDEANARLIAAAPEMYEALRMALIDAPYNLSKPWHFAARDAIAKAEGTS